MYACLDNESFQDEALDTLGELDEVLGAILKQTPEDQPALRAKLQYLRVSLRSVVRKLHPLWGSLEERAGASPLRGGRRRTDPPA
jgi:hypothetical protein